MAGPNQSSDKPTIAYASETDVRVGFVWIGLLLNHIRLPPKGPPLISLELRPKGSLDRIETRPKHRPLRRLRGHCILGLPSHCVPKISAIMSPLISVAHGSLPMRGNYLSTPSRTPTGRSQAPSAASWPGIRLNHSCCAFPPATLSEICWAASNLAYIAT